MTRKEGIKARVVHVEPRNRARIVSMPGESCILQLPVINPLEYAKFCRDLLGIKENEPLDSSHLKRLTYELELAPLAFFNPGNTWELVIINAPDHMRVYSPSKGIRDVPA